MFETCKSFYLESDAILGDTSLKSGLIKKKLSHIDNNENKPFHPHITIARVKNQNNIDKLLNSIDSMRNQYFGSEIFDNIKLKHSTLTPNGPIYQTLFSVPLSGDILNG